MCKERSSSSLKSTSEEKRYPVMLGMATGKEEMCEVCGGPATMRCGRCGALSVCSKACLKSYWPEHKRVCQKQEPAAGADALADELERLQLV